SDASKSEAPRAPRTPADTPRATTASDERMTGPPCSRDAGVAARRSARLGRTVSGLPRAVKPPAHAILRARRALRTGSPQKMAGAQIARPAGALAARRRALMHQLRRVALVRGLSMLACGSYGRSSEKPDPQPVQPAVEVASQPAQPAAEVGSQPAMAHGKGKPLSEAAKSGLAWLAKHQLQGG